MARTPKEPKIRICITVPESLVARLEPGNKSISSRAVELIEAGLFGSERIVIRMPLVYCPKIVQSGAPRPKPIPAAAPRQKLVKNNKVRTRRSPRPAARPAGIGWGPGSGLGPGKAINLNEYKDGVYIGKSKK